MKNLVICGGSGTRLWPISMPEHPKQFLPLFKKKSLFQLTLERNSPFCDGFLVILGQKHLNLAKKQIDEDSQVDFIQEPIGRNTAPAIALACFSVDSEEILLVSPADHLIVADKYYRKSLFEAESLAEEGNLVTFGILPTYAETGYGYICAKSDDVLAFCEKPDLKTAESYLDSGNYLWNSGMFCFKAGAYLAELKKYAPKIYEMAKIAHEKSTDGLINMDDMLNIPKDSIDYAVMERSKKVKVVPFIGKWNDLGSFDSLFEVVDSTVSIQVDSKNNLVIAEGKTVGLVGVKDSIIIAQGDNILVCKKGESQKVKGICDKLAKN